jgi:hypothetical protein
MDPDPYRIPRATGKWVFSRIFSKNRSEIMIRGEPSSHQIFW